MNKSAYASGSSVALKSFQSFAVNDGLLAKVVEAVKAGEKEARTSGDVKSFEVFYRGFRQNISIGRIFIAPVKVCNNFKNFPIALLYGTVVRELNLGEEVADLIEKKVGETEFDEYSQIDTQTIKDKLFYDSDSEEYRSLVLFAPNWTNIREYVGFKFTDDNEKLSNLLRHLVFGCYFNPAVSSAFDALMTTVDTTKLEVTDITPKLSYPFLSENPLKQYPDLTKTAGWAKPKVFLTVKTADAITKDVLDPEELNVFEVLEDVLTEAAFPATTPIEEAGEYETNGVKETKVEIPEVEAEATLTAGLQRRPDYGTKAAGSVKNATFDRNATNCKDCGEPLDAFKMCPRTTPQDAAKGFQFCGNGQRNIPNVSLYGKGSSSKKADTADNPANEKDGEGALLPKTNKEKAVTASDFDRNASKCLGCGKDLDAFKMCPDVSPRDVRRGKQFCGKPKDGVDGVYLPPILKDGSSAPFETPFTNVGPGTNAADNADESLVPEPNDKTGEPPIGIAIDENGLPRREEEARKVARYKAKKIAEDEEGWDAVVEELQRQDPHGLFKGYLHQPTVMKALAKGMSPEAIVSAFLDEFEEGHNDEFEEGHNASIVASAIFKDLDDNTDAVSTKTKAARMKREKELNRYATRRKRAEVSLTEESIWDDIAVDFGAAPQVSLPGESETPSPALPEAITTDKPEEVKGQAEEPAKAEEKALENPKSKSAERPKEEEPKEEAGKVGGAKGLKTRPKKGSVESDVSEAKSEAVSPDTVDADIKQPTESAEEAAKVAYDSNKYTQDEDGGVRDRREFSAGLTKHCAECEADLGDFCESGALCGDCERKLKQACEELDAMAGKSAADVSGDIAEAKSEVDANKAELADDPAATDTVNPAHFAAVKKVAYVAHVPGHRNSKGEAAPWVIKQHNTGKILESFHSEEAAKEGLRNMEAHKHSAAGDDHFAGFISDKTATAAGDDFTRAYIEAALWSSNDNSTPQGGAPLDKNYGPEDIEPETMAQMVADCDKFQRENAALIRECTRGSGQYLGFTMEESVEAQAGHDFWLTRNGHGAGFWDGDWPETGDELTSAAQSFGEYDLDVGDDGKIFGIGGHGSHTAAAEEAAKVASEEELQIERIAQLVSEGYTSGQDPYWTIKLGDEIPEDEMESATEHIAHLIREGYTSGYHPYWDLKVGLTEDDVRTAAAGDDTDESVEMSLGLGDLADLAVNLPAQDVIFTSEDEKIITAASKTAAYYTYYELTPAYGRDYKTKAEVLQAWNKGEDFEGDFQLGFKLVNINDIPKPCEVMLRYKGNGNVVSVGVK